MLRFLFFLILCIKAHALPVVPRIVEGDCGVDTEELLEFARDIYNSKIFTWQDSLPSYQMGIKDGYNILLSPLEGGHLYYADKDFITHYKIGYLEFWWPKGLKEKNTFFITQFPSFLPVDINELLLAESSQMLVLEEDIYNASEKVKHIESYNIDDLQNELLKKIYGTKSVENIYGGNSLQKPWLVKLPSSKSFFAINVGYAYEFLPDWKIYASYETQKQYYIPICKIRFRPANIRDAKSLFPSGKIRELALLLDVIISDYGNSEEFSKISRKLRSHLGQTLKNQIDHYWANLALRPQAIASLEPYNTTAEVVYELKKWSNKNTSNFRKFKKLKALYPLALKELSRYYHKYFCLSKDVADVTAKQSLDLAFRSYLGSTDLTYNISEKVLNEAKKQVYELSELIRESVLNNDFTNLYEHVNMPVNFFIANYSQHRRQQDYNLIARDYEEFETYFRFILNDDGGSVDNLMQQPYAIKWHKGWGFAGLSCLNHTIWIKTICTATPDFAKTEWWKSSDSIDLCSSINMKLDWIKLK